MAEIVNSAPQNVSKPHVNHDHSHFPIQFDHFDTHAFGYVKPHFVIKGISSDHHRHRPIVRTKSYTMKAPLMQDVYRKLSYFKVNLDAVLPINAEKILINPTIGDDVPDDANCVISYTGSNKCFFTLLAQSFEFSISSALALSLSASAVRNVLYCLIYGELFYSRGSLLASLGANLFNQFSSSLSGVNKLYDYDDFFDLHIQAILTALGSNSFNVLIDGSTYIVNPTFDYSDSIVGSTEISFRDFLTLIRETSDWSIPSSEDSLFTSVVWPSLNRGYTYSLSAPFNFQRVASYQLACAEFFTNDKVDYIYSAELYRQYIGDLIQDISSIFSLPFPRSFTYNGVYTLYDYLSGNYLEFILRLINSSVIYSSGRQPILQYFISLFGLKRSLKYKDYFAGSRTMPLAVGDVNVQVNSNNEISVVDVTQRIQVQRFLNFVNHTGRRLSNYFKGLFGVVIQSDRHVPQYIAELTEKVYTAEVENTGVNQITTPQSVTAVFSGNSSNKELDFGIDLESVIIGVTTYDIERAYTHTIDRDFFIVNRYDMFLPQLQFVGDQPVYRQEYNARDNSVFGSEFGYQFRDMQWKLMFSRASGGFAGKLPGFAFLGRDFWFAREIGPEFIRCFPTEFDNFFVSLAGWSLGNYWHFIVHTHNVLDSDRPMISNPVILE